MPRPYGPDRERAPGNDTSVRDADIGFAPEQLCYRSIAIISRRDGRLVVPPGQTSPRCCNSIVLNQNELKASFCDGHQCATGSELS